MDYATQQRQKLIGNKPPMPKSVKAFIAAIAVIVMWAWVNEQDYQEAVATDSQSCVYRGI